MKKVLLVIFILILIMVASGYYFLNTGKQIDISWTEEDFTTALENSKVIIEDIDAINLIALATEQFTTSGTNEVEATFSNAQMSALISKANEKSGPIKDFRVVFKDNNAGEISFKLSDKIVDFLKKQDMIGTNDSTGKNILKPATATATNKIINYLTNSVANKPIYASGYLIKTSSNTVNINIEKLKVGQIPVPADIISRVEAGVVDFVNRILSSSNGFSIEELIIEDGQLYYKGTLPAEVTGIKISE